MFKGFGSLGVQRHVGASERYYNGHLLSDGTHCQIPLVPDELSEKILVRSSRVRPIRSQLQTSSFCFTEPLSLVEKWKLFSDIRTFPISVK